MPVQLDVEEKAPIADASAPRDGLGGEAHDVATERVLLHGIERRENATPVGRGELQPKYDLILQDRVSRSKPADRVGG